MIKKAALVCVLMFGLTACGDSKTGSGSVETETVGTEAAEPEAAETEAAETENTEPETAVKPLTEPQTTAPEPVKYPVVLTVDDADKIELAFWSEGIFCIYDGSHYGYMTEDGRKITEFAYDSARPFHEGLACVEKDGRYGYIGKTGEAVIPLDYDRAELFSDGLAYFESGDRYGFMDQSGEEAFALDCDSVSSFSEGLAYYSIDGQYGYIDRTGEPVIPAQYDDAECFRDGLAKVQRKLQTGLIDRTGREILPLEYDSIEAEGSLIVAESGGKYGVFDKNGAPVLPVRYEFVTVYGEYIVFKYDGKYGLADSAGRCVLEQNYDWISVYPEQSIAAASLNGICGIIDLEGNPVVPFEYDNLPFRPDQGRMIEVKKGEVWGCLNAEDFSMCIPLEYEYIRASGDRAAVCKGGLWGVVDSQNREVIPAEYEDISLFDSGWMAAKKVGGKYRLFDRDGVRIGQDVYDSVIQQGRCYRIGRDGTYGYLDESGEEVIPPVYDYISGHQICTPYSEWNYSDVAVVAGNWGSKRTGCLILTEKLQESEDCEGLQTNVITPRIGSFHEFTRTGILKEFTETDREGEVELEELRAWEKIFRLYRVAGADAPVLYAYTAPYEQPTFPRSCSGFFALEDGAFRELLTASECGGSMGGTQVRLWYDREAEAVKMKVSGTFGGFGGRGYSQDFYEYQDGEASCMAAFYTAAMWEGDTEKEEYTIDGEEVTKEEYTRRLARFVQ